jgi:hypothetical protein
MQNLYADHIEPPIEGIHEETDDESSSSKMLECTDRALVGDNQGFFSTSMLYDEIRQALAYAEDGAVQRMTRIFVSPTNPFCLAATSAIGVVAIQTAWLSSTYTPLPLPKQDRSHGYERFAASHAYRQAFPSSAPPAAGVGMRIVRCHASRHILIKDLAPGGSAMLSGKLRPWDRIVLVRRPTSPTHPLTHPLTPKPPANPPFDHTPSIPLSFHAHFTLQPRRAVPHIAPPLAFRGPRGHGSHNSYSVITTRDPHCANRWTAGPSTASPPPPCAT